MPRQPNAATQADTATPSPSNMPRLGMIADDLTGACDAGVQFAQQGFCSVVRLARSQRALQPADLIILTTNSRRDSRSRAQTKVHAACRELLSEGRRIVFKKVDSTLRGNVYTETKAVMERCGYQLAVLTPAFPAMGRRVVGGWLYHGETPALSQAHVPTLLTGQGAKNVECANLDSVRKGSTALARLLQRLVDNNTSIAVVDAETDEDLACIAKAAEDLPQTALSVGSGGLAAQVARLLAKKYQKRPVSPQSNPIPHAQPGPVVLIFGSTHPVTTRQIGYLVANKPPAIFPSTNVQLNGVRQALKHRRNVMITLDMTDTDKQGFSRLATILRDPAVRGAVLSGGDTALSVCRALGVCGIKLEREILPGIPWGWLVGGPASGMPVATKAGGFGGQDAVMIMADFLANCRRDLK